MFQYFMYLPISREISKTNNFVNINETPSFINDYKFNFFTMFNSFRVIQVIKNNKFQTVIKKIYKYKQ